MRNYVSDKNLTKFGFIKIYEIISPPPKNMKQQKLFSTLMINKSNDAEMITEINFILTDIYIENKYFEL